MLISAQLPNAKQRSQRLICLLQTVADNEYQTHKLYTYFLKSSYITSNDVSDLCQTALHEDKGHFDNIYECLKRLEIKPTREHNSGLPNTQQHPLTIKSLLQHLYEIEAFSVKAYNEICNISLEYDYQIFDLSYRNMNENLIHLDFVSSLLSNLSSDKQL